MKELKQGFFQQNLSNYRKLYIFAHRKGLVAQLNSASDYGSEGFRFES